MIRTEVTPDGIYTYKDYKLVLKIEKPKEEKIMNKVLEIYLTKHLKMIEDKYDKLVKEDYEKIAFVKEYNNIVNTCEDSLKKLLEVVEPKLIDYNCERNLYMFSPCEEKIMLSIEEKYCVEREKEFKELDDLVSEVNAQLSLSDDLDYQIDVLTRYEIIDKKTKRIN